MGRARRKYALQGALYGYHLLLRPGDWPHGRLQPAARLAVWDSRGGRAVHDRANICRRLTAMSEYKITEVSQFPPREWEGAHGMVYYIKCRLAGHAKAVEIGKKSPDALKVGDTVHGTIEATEYPSDKFKPDPSAQHSYGGGGGNRQPKDEAAIKAQMSIKAAIQALPQADVTGDNTKYLAAVEELATAIFSMVDRVKNTGSVNTVFKGEGF